MSRKRKSRPYLMRGAPQVTEARATLADPRDHRVAEVPVSPLPAAVIRERSREIAIDPRLRAVNRCFERWAMTPSTNVGAPGYASVVLVRRSHNGPAPLDDAESKIVDAAIRASPVWAQRFVHLWYRQCLTETDMAKELAMKRREYVRPERDRVLCYYMGRLHEIGFSLKAEP